MTPAPMPPGRVGPRWLQPLRSAVPELTDADWDDLDQLETELRTLLAHPSQLRHHQPARGDALLATRRRLSTLFRTDDHDPAGDRPTEGGVRHDLRQTLRQVVQGFYDLDQRDATGPGHGRMILRHGSLTCRSQWMPRLSRGDLAGIAMTEPVGGTQVHAITTALLPAIGGGWRLTGHKCWISRIGEAAVFVVFARDPDGGLAAVAVDARSAAITRHLERPSGLAGWSWGRLTFDAVPVADHEVLTGPHLDGIALFEEHFAYYRPLVTATALGGAAAIHDTVAAHLAARERRGDIGRVRDHALIALGRTHAQITSALLAAVHSQRLTASAHPHAALWGRATKAQGVDVAREAADQLCVLVGAAGFTAGHHLQKTRQDLEALRYADGMHDSLTRAAGRQLLAEAPRHEHHQNQEGGVSDELHPDDSRRDARS